MHSIHLFRIPKAAHGRNQQELQKLFLWSGILNRGHLNKVTNKSLNTGEARRESEAINGKIRLAILIYALIKANQIVHDPKKYGK